MSLKNKIFGFFRPEITPEIRHQVIEQLTDREINVIAAAKGSGGGKSRELNYEAETLQAKSLKDVQLAIAMATDPEEPTRQYLEQLHKNLLLDNHLASVIDSRILYCLRHPYKIVNEKGDENEDITWLLERVWFEDFRRLALMSNFS